MTALKQQILKQIPNNFDRQYLIKMFTKRNYSITYADAVIAEFVHKGKVQRIARGKYKKTHP
jgi:hypothetical protein